MILGVPILKHFKVSNYYHSERTKFKTKMTEFANTVDVDEAAHRELTSSGYTLFAL